MKVVISGSSCDLDVDRVLGEGGEAVVLDHPTRADLAVKLHKRPEGAPAGPRRRKLEVLRALAPSLPFAAMPEALVLDAAGSLLGFTMRKALPTSEPLAAVASQSTRQRLGLGLRDVLALFGHVAESLERLHREGVIVGDLNDQNELFEPGSAEVTWIDTDSFQVEGFPCVVSTPLTLDPMLYGPSEDAPWLTADGKPRWFSRNSDWYAFTVLLFRALTGVHPFGGVGAAGANVVRRARARESVFSGSVVLPRTSRRRVEALDAGLRAHFDAVFTREERRPIERAALSRAARDVQRCVCGQDRFADAACVQCGTGAASSGAGDLDVLEWTSGGDILLTAASQGVVRVLVRRGARFVLFTLSEALEQRSEEPLDLGGAPDALEPLELTATHALFAARAGRASREDATLVLVDLASLRAESSAAERAFGAPACALTDEGLVRIVRGHVLVTSVRGERLLATAMRNQTRLFAGSAGAMLRTLAFGGVRFTALASGRATLLEVPRLDTAERLLEERVFCDAPEPVVLRRIARGASETLQWTRGAVTKAQDLGAAPPLSLAGAVLREDSLLTPTDAGVVRVSLSTGLSVVLKATEPHVTAGCSLSAHDAALYVVTSQRIRRLTRRSQRKGA